MIKLKKYVNDNFGDMLVNICSLSEDSDNCMAILESHFLEDDLEIIFHLEDKNGEYLLWVEKNSSKEDDDMSIKSQVFEIDEVDLIKEFILE